MVLSYNYAKQKMTAATNKCTYVAGHFDGHAEALKRYIRHRPMQHVQGYSGSHWMPPLSNYSLCITPVAARVTANNTKMLYVPTLMDVLMAIAMRWCYTVHIAQWRRCRAFIKVTKCRHRVSTHSIAVLRSLQCC